MRETFRFDGILIDYLSHVPCAMYIVCYAIIWRTCILCDCCNMVTIFYDIDKD